MTRVAWTLDASWAGRFAVTVEHCDQVIEEPRQFRGTDLNCKDRPGVLRMPAQVRLTPEPPRDLQALSVAEQEGLHVVSRRAPVAEDPEPPAQRVIFLLGPRPGNDAPVGGSGGQAGKGQGLAMSRPQPGSGLRDGPAELRDEDRIVVAGQPLTGRPQVNLPERRARPVADLRSKPCPVTEENRHPGSVPALRPGAQTR